MLVKNYELDVTSPPCDPGAERWNAIARLANDISPVLPYLNATLKGCIYDHEAKVLTWQRGGRRIVIRPREIAVTNLEDREEAWKVVESLVRTINRIWERRANIEPNYQKRERLKPMDVYKLLPGINCKACGEPSCFAFALKITAGQARLEECAPLYTEEQKDRLQMLEERLQAAGVS